MSLLKFTSFGGEVPRLTKRSLPDDGAQIAQNLRADTKEFYPLNEDLNPNMDVGLIPINETCRTLYRYPTDETAPIGTGLKVALARSPIVDDQWDRVYVSVMHGETEHPPVILSSEASTNTPVPAASLRPLGVKYPESPLALSVATVDEAFLTPWEAADFKISLLDQIKTIVAGALVPTLWNPAFALGSMPAFREDPYDPGKGIYQRMYVLTNPGVDPPVWNTLNGTPIENHLWTTAIVSPPYKDESTNRVYYANLPAKVLTWSIKSSVTAETAALQGLLIPGTTDRVLTDPEIDNIWATLRLILPTDPLTTSSTDLQTLLTRYQSEYRALVQYLDQGFETTISPQAAYQTISKAYYDLQGTVDGITTFYDKLAKVDFNNAIIEYFKAKLAGGLPQGVSPISESRYYTYTFVNDRQEESRPFYPATGEDPPLIEVNQSQAVTINRPALPAGIGVNDHITSWRVYRSSVGTNSADYLFVTEIPIAVSTYVDMRRSDALNESMSTGSWDPPPASNDGLRYLKHIVPLPGGFMAGFVDNTVYFCEPFHPYAWPSEYAISLQGDVVALGVFGVTLVVFTKRGPVYISGSAPGSMSAVVLESNEVCQSPRSVVPVAGGVLFASQNGLCVASQDGVKVLTDSLWTKKEWAGLQPENFICEEMNGVVYVSHTGGAVTGALHLPTMKFVRMDLSVTAWYSDFHTGELFAALPYQTGQRAKLIKLLDGTEPREAKWRSKRIVLEKETGFAWMRVEGEQTPARGCAVDIWGYYINASGVEVSEKIETEKAAWFVGVTPATKSTPGAVMTASANVTDTRPFRVGTGRYKDFEIEIRGKCRITSVMLASSTTELQGVN